MYCTPESIKQRLGIIGEEEDLRITTFIKQQTVLIDQKLSVSPDEDSALAVVLPIAAEEISAGEYLLAVAGENAVDGTLDVSVLQLGPDPDKIAKRGNELVDNGWKKLKFWLKPDIPFFCYLDGVDG